jgi:hypothetical protein
MFLQLPISKSATYCGGDVTRCDTVRRRASSGHARACGDVVNSPETQLSLHAFVKRDISSWPDSTVSSGYLVYSAGYYCAGYGGTSVSNRYYTEAGVINDPSGTHSGYVQAGN